MGGVEKLILKLTSVSTGVGVEARAELRNFGPIESVTQLPE